MKEWQIPPPAGLDVLPAETMVYGDVDRLIALVDDGEEAAMYDWILREYRARYQAWVREASADGA